MLECFNAIQAPRDFDSTSTVKEAKGFCRMLEDKDFFLDLFHQIIPCVDALFAQLQKRNIDAVHTHRVTKNFVDAGSRQ